MTGPEAHALGQRAVVALASLHARGRMALPWLPGMRARHSSGHFRVLGVAVGHLGNVWLRYATDADEEAADYIDDGRETWGWRRADECALDPRDATTCGCLLAFVREAWARPELAALRYPSDPGADGGWFVLGHTIARSDYDLWITNSPAASEGSALVLALEAAP